MRLFKLKSDHLNKLRINNYHAFFMPINLVFVVL